MNDENNNKQFINLKIKNIGKDMIYLESVGFYDLVINQEVTIDIQMRERVFNESDILSVDIYPKENVDLKIKYFFVIDYAGEKIKAPKRVMKKYYSQINFGLDNKFGKL